ncbi:MAG: YgfZ/GcvT domain-containing protein [Bradymonadia bacterium]
MPISDPQITSPALGDWAEAHTAGRQRAVLMILGGRQRMSMVGPDTADYLHRLLTWSVKDLQPGESATPFMLTTTGRVELHFGLLRVDEETFWLDLPPGLYDKAYEMLERFHFSEDLEFGDITEHVSLVSVQGPDAGKVLAAAGLPVPDGDLRHVAGEIEGQPLRVAQRSRIGGPGYDLWISGDMETVIGHVLEAGVVPVGGEALHSLRVEGGIPQYGAEYTDKSSPLEVSDLWGITDGKGCYPGQEAIEMTIARGRPPRALQAVDLSGEAEVGDDLVANGKAIGKLTSVATLPDGRTVALALVRRRALDAEGVTCRDLPAVLRSPGIDAM